MSALLDINVLISLLDPDHSLHARAKDWIAAHGADRWSSCPITENGCIRIMSHPSYPNALSPSVVIARLAEASASAFHEFWPDDVSLLDQGVTISTRIHGSKQITDLYLLALAVRHHGVFITFDAAVSIDPVRGAQEKHLVRL